MGQNGQHSINIEDNDNAPPVVLAARLGRTDLIPEFDTPNSEKWETLSYVYFLFCLGYFICVLYLTIIISSIKSELNQHPFLEDDLFGWWTGLALCSIETVVIIYKFFRERSEMNSTKEKSVPLFVQEFIFSCRINAVVLILSVLAMSQTEYWEWIFVFLCFFSWFSLLGFVKKFPSLGVYILVVNQIVKSFVQFLPIVIMLILPFSALFHWLLGEKEDKLATAKNIQQNETENQIMPPLQFFLTFVQTLVMMIGELDFKESVANKNSWMITSIFCVFLFLITVLLMNLLTSIAVTDTSELLKNATKTQESLRNDTIEQLEKLLPQSWRRKFWKFCEILGKGIRFISTVFKFFLKFLLWHKLPKPAAEEEEVVNTILRNQISHIQMVKTIVRNQINHFQIIVTTLESMERTFVRVEGRLIAMEQRLERIEERIEM